MSIEQAKRRHVAAIEVVVSIALAVLSIGSFGLQAYWLDAQTTARETILFSGIQFILTVGFGWFSTRALSRLEFERSLKRFAIGAYRRITDIEAMIERLRERLKGEPPGTVGSSASMATVNAVLEDTLQVVRSSTADWADVIGDELLTLETINSLRRQKGALATEAQEDSEPSTTATKANLRELDARIEKLVNSLPADLQIESRRKADDPIKRAHSADWMKQQHEQQKGLVLRVIAGKEYRCEGDAKALNGNTALSIAAHLSVEVVDSAGKVVGRALNNSPLAYDEFRVALCNCYGSSLLPVRFLRQVGERMDKDDGLVCWYEVQVTADPLREVTNESHAISKGAQRRHPGLKGVTAVPKPV